MEIKIKNRMKKNRKKWARKNRNKKGDKKQSKTKQNDIENKSLLLAYVIANFQYSSRLFMTPTFIRNSRVQYLFRHGLLCKEYAMV